LIRQISGDCRRNRQRLVDAREVALHKTKCGRGGKILNLL
jgi:hypothetical protein